jgi:hypothetical protein
MSLCFFAQDAGGLPPTYRPVQRTWACAAGTWACAAGIFTLPYRSPVSPDTVSQIALNPKFCPPNYTVTHFVYNARVSPPLKRYFETRPRERVRIAKTGARRCGRWSGEH